MNLISKSGRVIVLKKNIRKHLLILLLIVIGFAFYKKLFFFSLLVILAGALEYITNRGQIKLNVGHVFFLAMLFVRLDTALSGMLFIIFGGLVPQILIGNLDIKAIITYPLQVIIVGLSALFVLDNFMVLGIILATIAYGLTFIFAKAAGEPVPEMITEVLLPLFMNLIYFGSLSGPIMTVLGMVIRV